MSFELYGGIPRVVRLTAGAGNALTTTGLGLRGPLGKTNYLQVSCDGANPCRLYFTKADFDRNDNQGWLELAAATGFYEGPANLEDEQTPRSQPILYLRAVGGATDVVIVFYHRRS